MGTTMALRRQEAGRRGPPTTYLSGGWDKSHEDAKAIEQALRTELAEAESVTREDLMQLRCFQSVATITRYAYVRAAVTHLLEQGRLVEPQRGVLVMPSRLKAWQREVDGPPIWERYWDTITQLIKRAGGAGFDIADLLEFWSNLDQHLTRNTKRVALRQALTQMAKEGTVRRFSSHVWVEVQR